MTVASVISQARFTGNGATSSWSFLNKVFAATDLVVTLIDTLGNQYSFTNFTNTLLGLAYNVTNVDVDTGCQVNLTTTGGSPTPLTALWQIDIRSQTPEVQSTSIKNQGQFLPELHEEFFDRITREVQDILRLTYTFGIHASDNETVPWPALPGPAVRANTFSYWDGNGLPAVGVSIPAGTLTQALFNSFIPGSWSAVTPTQRTTAEIAAGVTPTNYAYQAGDVRRYGALGDGVTNDLAAIAAALNVCKAAGRGTVYLHPNDTYYCGTVATDGKTTPLISVTGLANTVIQGNGALITVNTTANVAGCLILLINPSNVSVYDLNFTDSGFDQSQAGNPNLHGTAPFFLTTNSTTDFAGFSMVNCYVFHALMLCTAYRTASGRLKGLQFLNCRAQNIYVGLGFQQQGDDVDIANFVCINPVRAYFPYGVVNHTVDMAVWNDGTNVNAGSNALCDIKRYDFDTKDIRLRLAYHGDTSIYGALVNLEADVTSASPAIFDSIDIDLRLAAATVSGSNVGFPVQFRDVTGGSTQATTATQWKRITLRGDFGAWPIANVNNPISIASVPNVTRGTLAFPAGFFDVQTTYAQTFAGFQIQTRPNTYVTSKVGDLTTGNTGATDARTIDCTNYTGTLFALRVTLYAEADANLGSTQQCYRRYLILGRNSAGVVTISSTNVENSYDAGAVNTVTVSASGNLLQFAFSTYTGANANMRMEVEHLSKFL